MKLTQAPYIVSGVANGPLIPVDTRSNPVNVWGSIVDSGGSTYAIHYTTADVYAAGYNPTTDAILSASTIPSGPTTGTKPFNVTGLGITAIQLQVTVGPGTVTLGPVFQSDSTVGA